MRTLVLSSVFFFSFFRYRLGVGQLDSWRGRNLKNTVSRLNLRPIFQFWRLRFGTSERMPLALSSYKSKTDRLNWSFRWWNQTSTWWKQTTVRTSSLCQVVNFSNSLRTICLVKIRNRHLLKDIQNLAKGHLATLRTRDVITNVISKNRKFRSIKNHT